jgi:alkylhydroperoxidase family enzyme
MSVAVLSGADARLPARAAALARFAVTLTAEPWQLTADIADELTAQGFSAEAIETATGVIATFNYLTRVADASGIEFDYASSLPAFEPDKARRPVPRPGRESWPVVSGSLRRFTGSTALNDAWNRWRGYVFDSDAPLSYRDRQLLARAAAEECCDRWRADQLHRYEPEHATESLLTGFARKLSREPWRMRATDLDALRAAGYSETALLHAIAVVALQNADSRLALARAVIASDPAR